MNRLTNNTDALHFLEREEPITLAPWEISEIVKATYTTSPVRS